MTDFERLLHQRDHEVTTDDTSVHVVFVEKTVPPWIQAAVGAVIGFVLVAVLV